MKLSAPKFITWLIALILGVVGILEQVGILKLAFIKSPYDFWLVVAGFGLLVLGTLFKGI